MSSSLAPPTRDLQSPAVNTGLDLREFAGDGAVFSRAYSVVPGSYKEETNSVEVVFSTGSRGLRHDYWNDRFYEEELEISPAAVDLSRFEAGTVQALSNHNSYSLDSVLGIATRGWIDGGECRAEIRLTQRPEAAGIVGDIKAGIIRAISVGYRVSQWKKILPEERKDGGKLILMRAVRWEPHEVSWVAVPFDANCSTRSMTGAKHQELADSGSDLRPLDAACARALGWMGNESPTAAPAAPLTRQEQPVTDTNKPGAAAAAAVQATTIAATRSNADLATITELALAIGRSADLPGWIKDESMTVDAVRKLVLDEQISKANAGQASQRNAQGAPNIRTVQDEGAMIRAGIAEAIANRSSAGVHKLTDNGKRFRGLRLLDLGRDLLENSGVSTRGMSPTELARAALSHRSGGMHSTSDFSYLLADVANKEVLRGMQEVETTYRRWARQGASLNDFKPVNAVILSAMPNLSLVNEHGEIKAGTISDKGLSYNAYTYATSLAFTYQAMVNDDLDEFSSVTVGMGASASRLENQLVYAQLTGNPVMEDGTVLFHASHNNLATGTGNTSVLGQPALTAGRTAMRLQKGLQGESLNFAPRHLIVPATLESLAFQLTSPNYMPTAQSGVSEFAAGGRASLEVVVDSTLDANSTTAWYLLAPSISDTVQFRFMNGAETPEIITKDGFDVLGTEIRIVHHFATRAVGWRGMYKGAGA